jgi:uncharacterized protein involved in outer membrane biogenesis
MSEVKKRKAPSTWHPSDAETPVMVELRAQIKKEINANVVTPIDWSIKSSRTAIKRAKMEFSSQNPDNPIFKLERKANVDIIIDADIKGHVKFNAVVSVI